MCIATFIRGVLRGGESGDTIRISPLPAGHESGDTIRISPLPAAVLRFGPAVSVLGDRLGAVARMARVVVPGVPHHVTQRGNRRQTTFFEDGDYEIYKSLMAEWCLSQGVEV